MQLKITFTTPGRKDLRKPLLVWINGKPEAVRGSMYDVLGCLTNIGFPEANIRRLRMEFEETGHTVLETDKTTEADIRRALEPPIDIVKALREAALARP
jgi:hypothetical protein